MGDTVKERILEFIKHKNITMKFFENQCGLSSGYVTSMRKGFGSKKLNNVLSAFPELNREWLLYGEGKMLNPSPNIDMTRFDSPGDNDVYGNIIKSGASYEIQSKISELEKENTELKKRNKKLESENAELNRKLIAAQEQIINLMVGRDEKL